MVKIVKNLGYSRKFKAILALVGFGVLSGLVFNQINHSFKANASAPAPIVNIQLGDDAGHSDPHLPGHCTTQLSGWGTSAFDAEDPDCLQLQITNQGPYTEDFRFCLAHSSGATSCSPWASEHPTIGATSSYGPIVSSNQGGNLSGTMTAQIETRSLAAAGLPAGTTFTDVSVGSALYYQKNYGPCTGNDYSPPVSLKWTFNGQPSPWAYGYYNDDDPGCFQAGLEVTMNAPPDAEFVSTTIPTDPTQLNPNQTYSNHEIIMRNKGLIWNAENVVQAPNPCYNSLNQDGQSCSTYQVLSSNRWKLKRIDNTPVTVKYQTSNVGQGDTIPFYVRQDITYTRRIGDTTCDPVTFNNLAPSKLFSLLERFQNLFVKEASAVAPIDEDPPGCVPHHYNYVETHYTAIDPNTGDEWNAAITTNETASFRNVSITTPSSPGLYELEFRMVDTSNLNNNNPPYQEGMFGTSGKIRLRVGGPVLPPVLSCGVQQNWYVGDPEPIQYSLSLTNGISPVTLTMDSSPLGPVMNPTPVVLNSTNSYTGIANIYTQNSPVRSYDLRFHNADNSISCTARLNILAHAPVVTVKYENQTGVVTVPNNSTGKVSYSVGGLVTSCTSSVSPVVSETNSWKNAPFPPFNMDYPNGVSVGPLVSTNDPYVFGLDCTGPGGTSHGEVKVFVDNAPAPTADFWCKADGDSNFILAPGPCHASYNSAAQLKWQSTDASSCTITNIPGTLGTSGTVMSANLQATTNFQLDCTGPGGTVTKNLTVIVGSAPLNISFTCDQNGTPTTGPCTVNYGGTTTLRWTTDYANCTIDNNFSNPNGSPANGSGLTPSLTQPTNVFTITCTKAGVPDGRKSVTINVLPNNPGATDFKIACSPRINSIEHGTANAYMVLSTESVPSGQPNGTKVNLSGSVTTGPYPRPGVNIAINSNVDVPANILVTLNTDSSPVGNYTIAFTGTSTDGSKTSNDSCTLSITAPPQPQSPSVSADSSVCDRVTVTITPHTPPTPTRYELYRGIPNNGNLIHTFNASDPLVFVDTAPGAQESNNYYYVIAYIGNSASPAARSNLANLNPCTPDMSNSDKDIVYVKGKFQAAFAPTICTGNGDQNNIVLPANALFAVGDILTFEIHICNRGDGDADNVQVKDNLFNPTNDSTKYNLKFPNKHPLPTGYAEFSPAGCAVVAGKTDTTIDYNISKVAKNNGICTIRFTAEISKPDNPSGDVYRFQNVGDIIVPSWPSGGGHYYTLPQLFSITGGVPNRNETAPH